MAAALILVVLAIFRYWRGGVALRATAADQGAAYAMGINVPRVFSLAWVAAGAIAAVSGVIVGAIGGISSSMGVFGLSVLVVVIVGGLDSVVGALAGGCSSACWKPGPAPTWAANTSCWPLSWCWWRC